MTGHYEDAIKSLDRLIPIIESDPRDVDSICQYLEASRDIKGLCHLLEYFSNKPIHAKYALSRLIQYRAGSAHAHELVVWLEKLAELSPRINPASRYSLSQSARYSINQSINKT